MKCKWRGCDTIISEVANLDGQYCFKHQRMKAERDILKQQEKEDRKRYTMGRQISRWVDDKKELDHFFTTIRRKDTKVRSRKFKINNRQVVKRYALYRYK